MKNIGLTMPTSLLLVILMFPWIPVQAQKCQVTYSQPNVKIQGHVIKRLPTPTSSHCVDECKGHQHCHSINFDQDKGMCELNNATHLTNPESMVYSRRCQYLNYFKRPAAKCSNKLCSKAKGKLCKMDKDGENYKCVRKGNHTIESFSYEWETYVWKKANSAPVCVGTKNDAFGKFTAPSTGQVQTIKLIHLSGGVAYSGGAKYEGNWGDKARKKFEIHVTYANNSRLAPPASYPYIYTLLGQDYMDKQLIFPNFTRPLLQVQARQLFKIWYQEDLRNFSEDDNSGVVCADVHMLYVDP
ncbi:hypothetical protein QZH41_008831 [Actinostola sp. cb2023]|nr:hypothetical protein QZH41_008831 [Actinostola sp. cb2023]